MGHRAASPKQIARALPLICSLLIAGAGPAILAQDKQAVDYELRVEVPDRGRVRIRIAFSSPLPGPRPFVFPRAVPMGYGEHPYDQFVSGLQAFSDARAPLPVERSKPPRWILGTAGSALASVEYEVDVARMEREILSGADASKIRRRYAGLLGYTIFGFLAGTEARPIHLRIEAPSGWPVFSTLAPRIPADPSTVSVAAQDFYALADSQILMGPDLTVRMLQARVPLFLAAYFEGDAESTLLQQTLGEAFAAAAAYFGPIPFPHYTVCQEHLRPASARHEYGFSMEHLESATVFFAAGTELTARSSTEEIARARFNLAHHIAHAWIPKRSCGEGYFPFDWEKVPVIDTIWFSEGFPQYAAMDALADSMPSREAQGFREGMLESRFRRNLLDAPDFIRRLSLIDLSRLASARYSEDFRIGRNVFSRGGLMAAEIDERIRSRSGGRHRLRDALRHLIAWSARTRRAFKVEEIPEIFREATGVESRDILERWLPAPAH